MIMIALWSGKRAETCSQNGAQARQEAVPGERVRRGGEPNRGKVHRTSLDERGQGSFFRKCGIKFHVVRTGNIPNQTPWVPAGELSTVRDSVGEVRVPPHVIVRALKGERFGGKVRCFIALRYTRLLGGIPPVRGTFDEFGCDASTSAFIKYVEKTDPQPSIEGANLPPGIPVERDAADVRGVMINDQVPLWGVLHRRNGGEEF
jgi:hypothetical protein